MKYLKEIELFSGKKYDSVVFDSDVDSVDSFYYKLENKNNLLFINIDTNNNIFGGFTNNAIVMNDDNDDYKCFLFTYNEHGLPDHFRIFPRQYGDGMYCYNLVDKKETKLYGFYSGFTITKDGSQCQCFSKQYKYLKATSLNGVSYPNYFTNSRVLVIQMK